MKKRIVPYGYEISNGDVRICLKDSKVVREIFDRYINGESMPKIAKNLSDRKIETLPGQSHWDTARIKRILECNKYSGDSEYPPFLPEAVMEKARDTYLRSRESVTPINSELHSIRESLKCSICGNQLVRKSTNARDRSRGWRCTSCKLISRIEDNELMNQITRLQRKMIDNPSLPKQDEPEPNVQSIEGRRLANEIHRKLDSQAFSEDELIQLALQCATENYQFIKSVRHISDRLTAVLRSAEPLSAFSLPLFHRTVKAVLLAPGDPIRLVLWDGSIIE